MQIEDPQKPEEKDWFLNAVRQEGEPEGCYYSLLGKPKKAINYREGPPFIRDETIHRRRQMDNLKKCKGLRLVGLYGITGAEFDITIDYTRGDLGIPISQLYELEDSEPPASVPLPSP